VNWRRLFMRRRVSAPRAPPGTAQHFHEQVVACMEVFNRSLPRLRRRCSDPAVAAALAMHAVGALSACVRYGDMTREQARHMVLQIAALEFAELKEFSHGMSKD
jgi:hypothetical protein